MCGNIIKKITALALALILGTGWALPVLADTPFQGFMYNYWGVLVPSPAAYAPTRSFLATDISPDLGLFNDPSDIHVCPYGNILLVDRGNNRIVVFDQQLNLIRVLEGFYKDGEWISFTRPNGVFVTQHREIFVADTLGYRVAILDWEGNFINELVAPVVEGLEDGFLFRPLQVLVDRGGRIYVIVQHVFEGIMSFSAAGDFLGYFGTIEVSRNWYEIIWRWFLTPAQIASRSRNIPTEFQSMALDKYNFVFTTNLEPWGSSNQIMRLNPRGDDVILNINETVTLSGDQRFRTVGPISGNSQLIDIIARPNGMFSALDGVRGRIYTYDSEGNLLYVFAGWGTMEGMTRRPVALEIIGDDILILDAHHGRVIQFAPTEYGALINQAIAMRYQGDDAGAVNAWRELTALDENFELAWAGIGRSLLAEGDNAAAMYYLRRGMDMVHFSIAFRRNRLDVMQGILPTAFTIGSALIGLLVVYKVFKRVRNRVVEA
jgi:hypothetical protein